MFEYVVFNVIVARAGRNVSRAVFCIALRAVVGIAARAILFAAMLRALVVDFVARAGVAVRELMRPGVAVRKVMFLLVLRAVVFVCVVPVSRTVVFFAVPRDMEFASRTAASAIPTPIKSAVMRYITFLILRYIGICYQKCGCVPIKKCPVWGDF